MIKPTSLYNEGMRPLIYSKKASDGVPLKEDFILGREKNDVTEEGPSDLHDLTTGGASLPSKNAVFPGWVRGGHSIAYYQNGIRKRTGNNATQPRYNVDPNNPQPSLAAHVSYYTLTFALEFGHDFDTVRIAQCYPYTYSDLQHDLRDVE